MSDDASADATPAPEGDRPRTRMDRLRARAFRVSDLLNRASVSYLGPAQHGNFRPGGTQVKPLSDAPCPVCGRPMSSHDLVRSGDARQRFYCPAPPSDG